MEFIIISYLKIYNYIFANIWLLSDKDSYLKLYITEHKLLIFDMNLWNPTAECKLLVFDIHIYQPVRSSRIWHKVNF